jgi:hypothetical protein
MCAYRDIQTCSCNHCCSRKAIIITCSECVFVAFGLRHAMCIRHIVVCFLSGCIIFFQHYLTNGRVQWSRGNVLAFGTQVRGFKPGRSRRNFKGEKILSTPAFGGEVKPSVPCRRFATCKRYLNGVKVVILAKIIGQHSRLQFLSLLGSLASLLTWRDGGSGKI